MGLSWRQLHNLLDEGKLESSSACGRALYLWKTVPPSEHRPLVEASTFVLPLFEATRGTRALGRSTTGGPWTDRSD